MKYTMTKVMLTINISPKVIMTETCNYKCHIYVLILILCAGTKFHVDKAVAKVTLIRYVDTVLFYVYLEFLNGISISICKL